MHNFDIRCIFSSLCVVFCYDHTTDCTNIITIQWILFSFFVLFSFLLLLFCRVTGLVFISFPFISKTLLPNAQQNIHLRLRFIFWHRPTVSFIHIMLKCRHFCLLLFLSLSGSLLQWHSKSYKNIMKTMFGARCEYRKGKHLVNYKIESHFIHEICIIQHEQITFRWVFGFVICIRAAAVIQHLVTVITIHNWLLTINWNSLFLSSFCRR